MICGGEHKYKNVLKSFDRVKNYKERSEKRLKGIILYQRDLSLLLIILFYLNNKSYYYYYNITWFYGKTKLLPAQLSQHRYNSTFLKMFCPDYILSFIILQCVRFTRFKNPLFNLYFYYRIYMLSCALCIRLGLRLYYFIQLSWIKLLTEWLNLFIFTKYFMFCA